MNRISAFLLFASGADTNILKQCPSDNSKYMGMGGTIFFTGLFASIAAGYALFTVFDSYVTASILGILWGLMIFNLDRFIVSSMRKEEKASHEWLTALPRIILAGIISIVIAKPIELKIFEKEINPELVVMEQQAYSSEESEVRNRFEPATSQLRKSIETLKLETTLKAEHRDRLAIVAQQEADGTGGSKIKNLGPIYQVKKDDSEKAQEEYNLLSERNSAKIVALESRLAQAEEDLKMEISRLSHTRIDGPAARMEALSRLTSRSIAMQWTHVFILLLFLMIECAPILVKLLSRKGPYDSLLHTVEHGYRSREIESIAAASAEARKRSSSLPASEQEYLTRKLDAELL